MISFRLLLQAFVLVIFIQRLDHTPTGTLTVSRTRSTVLFQKGYSMAKYVQYTTSNVCGTYHRRPRFSVPESCIIMAQTEFN